MPRSGVLYQKTSNQVNLVLYSSEQSKLNDISIFQARQLFRFTVKQNPLDCKIAIIIL